MKKWRTIPKALKEMKEIDPGGAITEYGLRKMVKNGEISSIRNGKNILIDLTEVWEEK